MLCPRCNQESLEYFRSAVSDGLEFLDEYLCLTCFMYKQDFYLFGELRRTICGELGHV